MKNLIFLAAVTLVMSSCMPDSVKDKMNEGIMQGHQMLADQEFKKVIGQIELHKLRNGNYPGSLSELKFLTAMDSSISSFVEYTRFDSVYELNLKLEVPLLDGEGTKKIELQYPSEFWKGLGCIKSNLK